MPPNDKDRFRKVVEGATKFVFEVRIELLCVVDNLLNLEGPDEICVSISVTNEINARFSSSSFCRTYCLVGDEQSLHLNRFSPVSPFLAA